LEKILEADQYAQLSINVVLPIELRANRNTIAGSNTSTILRSFNLSAKVATYLKIVYDSLFGSSEKFDMHEDNLQIEDSILFQGQTVIMEKPVNMNHSSEFDKTLLYNRSRPSLTVLLSNTEQEHKQLKDTFSIPALTYDTKYDVLLANEYAKTVFSCFIEYSDAVAINREYPTADLSTLSFNIAGKAKKSCTTDNVNTVLNKKETEIIMATLDVIKSATDRAHYYDAPTCGSLAHDHKCKMCDFSAFFNKTERLTESPSYLLDMLNDSNCALLKSTNDQYHDVIGSLFKDNDFIDVISSLALLINMSVYTNRLGHVKSLSFVPEPDMEEILPQGVYLTAVDRFRCDSTGHMYVDGFSALAETNITNYLSKLEKSFISLGIDPTMVLTFLMGTAMRALTISLRNKGDDVNARLLFFSSRRQRVDFTKKEKYSSSEISSLNESLAGLPLFTQLLQ
jgi:hypothetical protein